MKPTNQSKDCSRSKAKLMVNSRVFSFFNIFGQMKRLVSPQTSSNLTGNLFLCELEVKSVLLQQQHAYNISWVSIISSCLFIALMTSFREKATPTIKNGIGLGYVHCCVVRNNSCLNIRRLKKKPVVCIFFCDRPKGTTLMHIGRRL